MLLVFDSIIRFIVTFVSIVGMAAIKNKQANEHDHLPSLRFREGLIGQILVEIPVTKPSLAPHIVYVEESSVTGISRSAHR